MKRYQRNALLVLLALLGLAVVLIVAYRDLPRRKVQAVLAERLGADVRVGALVVRGSRSFRLEDVIVRQVASEPRLERLTIETVEARGSIREILASRFESLDLSGVTAVFTPPDPEIEPTPPPEASDLTVGRLRLRDLNVVIAAGGAESRITGEAAFDGIGTAPEGSITVRATEISLAPLLELFGRPVDDYGSRSDASDDDPQRLDAALEEAVLELALSEEGRRVDLEGRADRLTVTYGDRELDFDSFSVDGGAVDRDGELPIDFRLTLNLPHVESVQLVGEIDPESLSLIGFRGDVIGASLEPWLSLFPQLPEGMENDGTIDLRVGGSPESLVDYLLTARLSRLRYPFRDRLLAAEGVSIEWAGQLEWTAAAPQGPVALKLTVPKVDGTIDGYRIPAGLFPISATLTGKIEAADRVSLNGRLAIDTRNAGTLSVDGLVEYSRDGMGTSASWTWEGAGLDDLAALLEAGGAALPGTVRLDGTIRSRGTAGGDLPDPRIEGTIEVSGRGAGSLPPEWTGSSGDGGWEYREAQLTAGFELSGDRRSLHLTSIESEGTLKLSPLEPIDVCLHGSASVDLATGESRLHSLEFGLGDLGRLALDGARAPGSPEPISGRLRLDDVVLSRVYSALVPILGDRIPGYSLGGSAGAELTGSMNESGDWSSEGKAWLREGGFSSEDGSRVAEGLEGTWNLRLEGSSRDGVISSRAAGRTGGFLMLWGSFFADYSDLELNSELSLELEPEAGSWRGQATLRAPDGPLLTAALESIPDAPLAYSLAVVSEDLDSTFDRYLRRPLQGSVDLVERLRASGRARIRLEGRLSEARRTARGSVKLEDLGLGGAGGEIRVEKLDLDLPVDLAWEPGNPDEPPVVSGEPLAGSLGFARLMAGGLEIPETSTGLLVNGDSIQLDESLSVPFLGGVLEFEKLTLAELLRPSRHLESAMLLEKVSLSELTGTFEFLPLEGTIDGYFPKIWLNEQVFRMEGDGEFALLGGKLRVSDIRGRELLSQYPRLTFSTRFEEIDLQQLTGALDFGEMTGVLRGELRDCQLALGVPVRFEGRIETVPRPGVTQKINVKAVNNIAILGTGGNVGILDRGIQRFFKHYTYQRLGIEMKLENDRFLLRGLERRGDKELFLKGRLPFPIDVVNAQPGQTVSFRTMMDRVGSLDFAGVTTVAPPAIPPGSTKR
jgi:hypothetical protein